MALHDKLIAFSIISEHSTWGGGTITRHGQCGPTVATALPSLVPRLALHPLQHLHLPTTPPGHFLRRGSPCCVGFRKILSTLPHQCQGILPRIANNVLLFDHFYEPTKYCSKCIAFTNSVRHSLTHHLFVQVILFCEFFWGKVIAATYESRSSHRQW